jgi:hypothetical protein
MPETMTRTLLRFVSLFATALLAGPLFCHVLEMPAKMALPAELWLPVQQTLYNMFGPVSAPIELIAILSTALLALSLLGRGGAAGWLTMVAALLLAGHLVEWFAVVAPANRLINGWTPATLPPDWAAVRDRWEYGHAAGAALVLPALALLILAGLGRRRPMAG